MNIQTNMINAITSQIATNYNNTYYKLDGLDKSLKIAYWTGMIEMAALVYKFSKEETDSLKDFLMNTFCIKKISWFTKKEYWRYR